MDDAVDVEDVVRAVHRVEDAPLTHRVLGEAGQVGPNRLVPEIAHVGGEPLGLVEEALGQLLVERSQIGEDFRFTGEAVPGHGALPFEAELVGDFVAADALGGGEGFLEACTERFAQRQTQIRIAEELAKAIVHKAAHEFLELVGGETGQIHALS